MQPLGDSLQNYAICSINKAIGLWVSYRGEAHLRPYLHTEFLEHLAVKLGSIFLCEFSRYSKAAYDLPPKESFDGLRGYSGKWLGLYPFGEVLNGDHRVAKVT
jgi:hypothetical protein